MPIKLLVCDDEIFIRLLVEKNLEKYDVEIKEAVDGAQAVSLSREWLPDLIIMDYAMPNMNGHEAIMKLKSDKSTDQIPIVFLTGLNLRPDIKDDLNKEVKAYLVKPFKRAELLEAVETALGRALPQKNV